MNLRQRYRRVRILENSAGIIAEDLRLHLLAREKRAIQRRVEKLLPTDSPKTQCQTLLIDRDNFNGGSDGNGHH